MFFMLSRLFIAVLWSPAGQGLTSWLLFVMFNCVFVTFSCGILVQVWYLFVSIPDLCHLSYFDLEIQNMEGFWIEVSTIRKNYCSVHLLKSYMQLSVQYVSSNRTFYRTCS